MTYYEVIRADKGHTYVSLFSRILLLIATLFFCFFYDFTAVIFCSAELLKHCCGDFIFRPVAGTLQLVACLLLLVRSCCLFIRGSPWCVVPSPVLSEFAALLLWPARLSIPVRDPSTSCGFSTWASDPPSHPVHVLKACHQSKVQKLPRVGPKG